MSWTDTPVRSRLPHRASFFLFGITATLVGLNAAALFLVNQPLPEVAQAAPPPEPRDYLAQRCQEPDCDFDLLDKIVFCESSWRMVKNSSSSAYGYFQIIDSTERGTPQYAEGKRKYNPYTNIDMGIYLYERYGTSPWNESRRCWWGR